MQTDNQNVFPSPEPVKVNENPPSTPINQYNQVSAQAVPMPPEPQPVPAPVKTEVPVQPVVEERWLNQIRQQHLLMRYWLKQSKKNK